MQRRANGFRIVTRWEVAASLTEVATILQDAARFPDWWSEVYLDVKSLNAATRTALAAVSRSIQKVGSLIGCTGSPH